MIYMGSKTRIAKDILNIMLKDIGDRYFVDCFCGGGNLIQFADCKNKIASDINPYTIAFLKKIQKDGCDWLPKNNYEFTKGHYNYVRNNKDKFSKEVLGHVGYNLSFGGKWFGGWRFDNKNKDYVKAGYEHAIRQADKIKDVKFVNSSYLDLEIPDNSVIYCDIPYKNTTKYSAVDKNFDYEQFYDWCRRMKLKGHIIYVSEYNMPEDFKVIWQKQIRMTLKNNSNAEVATEKLYSL